MGQPISIAAVVGDACSILNPSPYAAGMTGQVLVTNESGMILSAHDLRGGVWETPSVGDQSRCDIELTIDVPNAAVYTVMLDGDAIRTFPASSFPLGPENWVMISLN